MLRFRPGDGDISYGMKVKHEKLKSCSVRKGHAVSGGCAARAKQVEDAERRVNEALHVSNMPALQSQLAAATAATATEGLWDDPQAGPCTALGCCIPCLGILEKLHCAPVCRPK